MSLFPEITSMNHEIIIEGVKVSYKYFVNDRDIWWYCFDDIVEFIHMNENYANMLYDKEIPEDNKVIWEDWNYYNDYGVQQSKPRRFVTSDVVRQFIERNNQRNNILIKSINNLEFKEDAHEKYFEDDELAEYMKKFDKAYHNKDYEEIADCVYEMYHTDTMYDILDKFKEGFDKEVEQAVDVIREKLYAEEIKQIVLQTDDSIERLIKDSITDEWRLE